MRIARLRTIAWRGLAALGVVLLTIAGCTMVGDNITGVNLRETGPTTCVKQCNDTYKDLYAEEQKRHIAALEACQALEQPTKGECLVAEDALHSANKDVLGAAKIDCQNDCHRQGSGSAS